MLAALSVIGRAASAETCIGSGGRVGRAHDGRDAGDFASIPLAIDMGSTRALEVTCRRTDRCSSCSTTTKMIGRWPDSSNQLRSAE